MSAAKKGGLGRGMGALIRTAPQTEAPAPAVEVKANESGVMEININDITPNREQPRKTFEDDSLQELAESIKQHGVIQPVTVRKLDKGYEIVAGERRWRASRLAGLKQIPCIIRDYSEKENMMVALIENLQREDLNPMDEASAYSLLQERFGLTQEELSSNVGKSRPYIANSLRLLKLPSEIRKMVEDNRLSPGHARALLSLPTEELQIKYAIKICSENLSVRETEALVKASSEKPSERKHKSSSADTAAYRTIETQIRENIGAKVKIKENNNKGTIQLSFYSREELERLTELLMNCK